MLWLGNHAVDSARLAAALLLFGAALAACERGDPPREVRLEVPSVIESRDPVTVVVRAVNAQGVAAEVREGASFAVEPSELAKVSQPGLLICSRSGDGKLTVTIVGVSRSVPVRCRMVDRVEASDMGRVDLNAGPFKPKVRVLDKAGAELNDVDVAITSKNAGVVSPKEGQLVPKLVGHATLTARAGAASAEFTVDIVRKLTPEALPIDGNRRIYFSLDAGKYELKVTLHSPKRVTVEWRGAPYCNAASDGLEHISTCGLRATGGGGVVFDNPAYLEGGAKKISVEGVELYEVP